MAIRTDFGAEPGSGPRDLRFFPADPAAARTLSPAQVEPFNRDGFVPGLPAFRTAEIDRIRACFDDLLRTPVLLDFVEDLLGPRFGCWGSHLFCKLPGDPMEVPLHQDATYWPLTPSRSVTVWLALDDVDAENAAMEFVPGSHGLGPLPHEELPLDGSRVLERRVAEPGRFGVRATNALRAGEVSVHSDLLLHGSGPNRSGRRRAGLTLRYAAGEQPEKMAAFTGTFDGNPVATVD